MEVGEAQGVGAALMHDVIIIGGGPGGLATGRLLAREGFDVVLFEEHPSSVCRPDPFWLLTSVGSSVACAPGRPRYSGRE